MPGKVHVQRYSSTSDAQPTCGPLCAWMFPSLRRAVGAWIRLQCSNHFPYGPRHSFHVSHLSRSYDRGGSSKSYHTAFEMAQIGSPSNPRSSVDSSNSATLRTRCGTFHGSPFPSNSAISSTTGHVSIHLTISSRSMIARASATATSSR